MDQERTYKWIQERLRELHSGTLSEQDLARLKDIARHDPFVADALEGFDSYPNGQHARHLHAIEQKIKQPKRERRRWLMPNLTVTAIAASVLVIIATYAVITRIQKENEETLFVFVAPDSLLTLDSTGSEIAMEESAGTSTESATGESTSLRQQTQPEKTSKDLSGNEEAKPSTAAETDHKAIVAIEETKPSGITPPAAAVAPADDEKSILEDVAITSKTEMARAKKDEGYFANQMDPTIMNSRVTGRIVDALTGEPLAGAKLIVNYTNQLFYSDINGYFELSLPEHEGVLQATYSGLADSALVIKQGEENIMVGLKAGSLIPPMNIAGLKNKGPVASPVNPAISAHLNFNRHLHSSTLLQLTSEPSAARRKVTVQFKVRKDGSPADFTLLESSRDKTYDGEAIRLIKDGPEWVCPGGEYPCVRQYTFYFR